MREGYDYDEEVSVIAPDTADPSASQVFLGGGCTSATLRLADAVRMVVEHWKLDPGRQETAAIVRRDGLMMQWAEIVEAYDSPDFPRNGSSQPAPLSWRGGATMG